MRFILASSSPRRSDLLAQIGLRFEVIPPQFDESRVDASDPAELVHSLAREKAGAVAAEVEGPAVVLGADTIVLLDGEVLGKPRDEAEARSMLARLAGRTHRVLTGVALIRTPEGPILVQHEETHVTMRPLTPGQIHAYVASGEPMDKAGAYAVQGLGSVLVERIQGDYFNVVGLPLPRLALMLESLGLDVLDVAAR
ncbi:MAG: Maf family protein [Bacillota bacterium]